MLEKSEEGWEDSEKLIDFVKSKLSNMGMDVIAAKELVGDDGIVSGCCEGDMNSVIAMYLLQEFSGQPVHF